jgi:hypothetical protein
VVSLSNHGSRPAKRRSSGMTGWANCDSASKGEGILKLALHYY